MSEEPDRSETENDTPLSRRNIVKALGAAGGAGITGTLSAPTGAVSPEHSSVSAERITGTELRRLIRTVAKRDDVRHLMGGGPRETVLGGRLLELAQGDQARGIITRDPGATQSNVLDEFNEEDVVVSAARHTLADGNEVTVTSFVAGSDEVILYYDYEEPHAGTSTKARVFDIVGDGTPENTRLVARGTSANGKPSKEPLKFSIMSSCEGCQLGPGNLGSREVEECVEIDYMCAGSCCGACTGASLCGPYAIYCGIACVATWCLACIGYCCTGYGTNCQAC